MLFCAHTYMLFLHHVSQNKQAARIRGCSEDKKVQKLIADSLSSLFSITQKGFTHHKGEHNLYLQQANYCNVVKSFTSGRGRLRPLPSFMSWKINRFFHNDRWVKGGMSNAMAYRQTLIFSQWLLSFYCCSMSRCSPLEKEKDSRYTKVTSVRAHLSAMCQMKDDIFDPVKLLPLALAEQP